MKRKLGLLGVIVTLTLASLSAGFADTALVVGVNLYPGLRDGENSYDLRGCVNDAQAVAQALKQRGFDNVLLLTDAQATKENIFAALLGLNLKSTERFAFYFAGHGVTNSAGGSNLVMSNSRQDTEANDINAKDLYGAIAALDCHSRSVLLDSCFSGGMILSSRGKGIRDKDLRTRGYVRRGFSPATTLANGKDIVEVSVKAGDICYLAASRANEQAMEDRFGGDIHGVFTKFLVDVIGSADNKLWGDVHAAVDRQVEDYTDLLQHPTLAPGYTDKPLFGDDVAKPDTDKKWDVYHNQNVDPTQIILELAPNNTTLTVNKDLFALKATVGKSDGYLVILERGTSGNINLLFPRDASVASSQVKAGQLVAIPGPGKQFACDKAGHEFVKAIIFKTEAGAKALLDLFAGQHVIEASGLRRDIFMVDTGTDDSSVGFYTSDVAFEVVNP